MNKNKELSFIEMLLIEEKNVLFKKQKSYKKALKKGLEIGEKELDRSYQSFYAALTAYLSIFIPAIIIFNNLIFRVAVFIGSLVLAYVAEMALRKQRITWNEERTRILKLLYDLDK